jgi:tRNA nucleotidyltransferase (CCA-adding enzyme)
MERIRVPTSIKSFLERIGRLADERQIPAYAVGGCVRDWLLGIQATEDLDIALEGNALELARAFADEWGQPVTAHHQFGTATVVTPPATGRGRRRIRVDFAMCRKETYAEPAAYPRVSPGTLDEDLFRRDFTVNAMAMALGAGQFGRLVDPFGGARDLRRGTLRVLHAHSFLDDPSRVLRGIRFLSRFGLAWDRTSARLAREAVAAGALGWLNVGRLQREFDRMCEEPDPLRCFLELARLLTHHSSLATRH